MNKGLRIGYIRVSTDDQNPDRQLEGIELDKKFIDYVSGKSYIRQEFDNLMNFVREGDKVIVHSMDRLARNVDHLRKIVQELNQKKISIEFIKENLLFNGDQDARSNLLLTMMGAFAEFEHALIRERQREGIELAKKRGVYAGRKKTLTIDQQREIKDLLSNHARAAELAKKYNVSRPTIYACKKVSEIRQDDC